MSRNPVVYIALDGPIMPHMKTPCFIPVREHYQSPYPTNATMVRRYAALTKVRPVMRHRCDNHECVNLAHVVPGRACDNARDRFERGVSVAPKLMLRWHIDRGHTIRPECPAHIRDRLGAIPDKDIARVLMVSVGRVAGWRRMAGIKMACIRAARLRPR